MADETTIVEFVETEARGPGDGLKRNSAALSDSEFDISKKVKNDLKSGCMSDLTVKVQDGQLRCQSYILYFASPKLAAMIQNSPHEIVLPGVTTNTFKTLLRIICSEEADEIKSDCIKILDVVKIAHEMNVNAAVTYCSKLLREYLKATNVCLFLNLAILLDHLELKEDCTKVIREKTDEVLKSEAFLKCDVATLEHILKQKFVHNVTELDLFQATVCWSKRQENPREALGSNLSLIRLGALTTKDIAAHVGVTNLLTVEELKGLLWYFLAEGKGEMPAGFSNEKEKRHTTWSLEHFRASIKEIPLLRHGFKYVTAEEMLATPPLRISVNEDAFLIGVKYMADRAEDFDTYMDDVEVTLMDENGTPIAMAKLNSEVEDWDEIKLTFSRAIELCANVMYELKFSINGPGVDYGTYEYKKYIYYTDTNVELSVFEDTETPIRSLIIAPNVQCRKKCNFH